MGIFYQHRTSLEWSRVEICRLGFTRSVFLILSVLLLFHTSYSRELQFFHITDLHVDNLYSVDGSISERCHIPKNGNLSGEKLGPGGNYSCDPPILLIESALVYMKSINPDPDFIIWTGDSNPHWIEGPDFGYIFSNLKNLTKLFRKYFPDTMIVPTLGNHDTDPPDQYVDYSVSQEEATQFYSR